MCRRNTPSRIAPSFSSARCDWVLRRSVLNCTRTAPKVSNSCTSWRYFASVFASVPCADGISQEPPISTRRCGREISIQRVEPMTAPVSHDTTANGTSSPRAACAAACAR